jgi:cytochrome d ubiquinol oxidase subunit I
MVGDMHGLNTLKHQPAKIAAIEGHWENPPGEPTPLLLFGWPDMEQERTRFGLEIPALGSLILTHSLDKQVPALKEFPKKTAQIPPSSSGRSALWRAWAC